MGAPEPRAGAGAEAAEAGAGAAEAAGADGPRRDTRGIVDAPELFTRVRFRRREPAPPLRPYLEHYWLIDWDLAEPYATHVVPHPSVNVVFQRYGDEAPWGEVAGIGLGLFTQKLAGRGRVCGVQFRPGGFRPFAPAWPVSEWTGRRVPVGEVLGVRGGVRGVRGGVLGASGAGAPGSAPAEIVGPEAEDARVAALDAFLLGLGLAADPRAERAMALVDQVRSDRTIRRVAQLAAAEGVSARSLQRLFAAYVGVGPKWVILRYRIHEALERAETRAPDSDSGAGAAAGSGSGFGSAPAAGSAFADGLDWAALAAELGYSDQAHLVRDFTATVGVPPTAYATRPPRSRGPAGRLSDPGRTVRDMDDETSVVRIEPWSDEDFALLQAANTPELMAHLGGPETDEKLAERHKRYVSMSSGLPGAGRMYRVVLTDGGEPVGSVGFWESTWQGEQVYETGWTVLPGFQGRGIATAATLAVVEAARAAGRHRYLHAFPSVENTASNGVCRKAGFSLVGECDFEYPPGNPIRGNSWRLDLLGQSTSGA